MYTRFLSALPQLATPTPTPEQPPQLPPPIPTYAKWSGYVDGQPTTRASFLSKTHIYEMVQRPAEPLALGMRIKIYAVSPALYCSPDAPANEYEAYDAHVTGRITRIVGWRGTVVGLEVQNECWRNMVKNIRLEAPYIPDVTVRRLAHLKAGRGPKEARDDWPSRHIKVVLPPAMWDCGATRCAMRETGILGDGVLYVYWTTDPELHQDESGERPRKRRTRGNLEAIGWAG